MIIFAVAGLASVSVVSLSSFDMQVRYYSHSFSLMLERHERHRNGRF